MKVIITLDNGVLQTAGISDEQLPDFVRKLGLPVTNEKMLKRFKVLSADLDEGVLTELRNEPSIADISLNEERRAL